MESCSTLSAFLFSSSRRSKDERADGFRCLGKDPWSLGAQSVHHIPANLTKISDHVFVNPLAPIGRICLFITNSKMSTPWFLCNWLPHWSDVWALWPGGRPTKLTRYPFRVEPSSIVSLISDFSCSMQRVSCASFFSTWLSVMKETQANGLEWMKFTYFRVKQPQLPIYFRPCIGVRVHLAPKKSIDPTPHNICRSFCCTTNPNCH